MRITEMKLRASTLVETLVMMIVAGMVFLLVTEGLGMFKRLQGRLIAAMESDAEYAREYTDSSRSPNRPTA